MASIIDGLFGRMANQSAIELPFQLGCSEKRVRELEATVHMPLPDDYGALLLHRNGQSDRHRLTFPPDQIAFLPADEVARLWTELQEYRDDQFFDALQDGNRVRGVLYHPGRVPIACNEAATAYLSLDFVPGPRGRAGQLVFNVNETDCVVVEDGVRDLFQRYDEWLRTGQAQVERRPPDCGDGYWFTAGGRYIDWAVYDELKRTGLRA